MESGSGKSAPKCGTGMTTAKTVVAGYTPTKWMTGTGKNSGSAVTISKTGGGAGEQSAWLEKGGPTRSTSSHRLRGFGRTPVRSELARPDQLY